MEAFPGMLEADLFLRGVLDAVDDGTSVLSLTDDSQIGANLQVCPDEENRADWDQRLIANDWSGWFGTETRRRRWFGGRGSCYWRAMA